MSFPKYPEYKNSGASLLREIPTHWTVSRLKRFGRLITGITPPSEDLDNYTESGWPWVRPDDLYDSVAPVTASKFLTDQGWSHCRSVSPASTLVCCIGSIGKLGYTNVVTCTNQQITAVEPIKNARYLFYLIYASKSELDLRATGNVLRILNSERLGSVPVAMPSSEEAAQIARFLDHETAKIDTLIREQERLIELLQEKRQAVISHAVTKGLDPDVPMKDSGVEWLGEVPEHWVMVPLKTCITSIHSGTSVNATDYPASENEYGVLKTSCVYGGMFRSTENKTVFESEVDRLTCPLIEGSLIVSRMNTPDLVGSAGLVEIAPPNIYLPDRLWQVTLNQSVSAEFVDFWTKAGVYRYQLKAICAGTSSSMQNIGQDDFRGFLVAFPPIEEQNYIAEFLGKQTRGIDNLVHVAKKGIQLLQERRSALISAAVTGKIDVRDWQPPVNESAFKPEVLKAGSEATV